MALFKHTESQQEQRTPPGAALVQMVPLPFTELPAAQSLLPSVAFYAPAAAVSTFPSSLAGRSSRAPGFRMHDRSLSPSMGISRASVAEQPPPRAGNAWRECNWLCQLAERVRGEWVARGTRSRFGRLPEDVVLKPRPDKRVR